jgi:hypothetical protein
MPSRPVIVGILLLWAGVMAVVARRELLPLFSTDTPPVPAFVVADELSQATVNWTLYRGKAGDDTKVGTLTTRTEHVKDDNSFRFVTGYRDVQLRAGGGVALNVQRATVKVRVSKDGRLLEQTADGVADIDLGKHGKLGGTADVRTVVRDGQLVGTASLSMPGLLDKRECDLTPVPVPDGQVLNPLMPTDRLRDVTPGRMWKVRQADPLRDAMTELFSKEAEKMGGPKFALPTAPELTARVLDLPEDLPRPDGPVSCWVIEYKCDNPPVSARTWVRRDDGRVLRQEATAYGERMRFERER